MILTGWTLIIVLVMDTIMVNKTGSYDDIIFNIQLNFDTNHQPPTLSLYLFSPFFLPPFNEGWNTNMESIHCHPPNLTSPHFSVM